MPDMQTIIDQIAADMAAAPDRGKPADYIPALARVSPDHFGIAVVLADGQTSSRAMLTTPFRSSQCPRSSC
jgi:glutaminase